jgi:hypothetical protein
MRAETERHAERLAVGRAATADAVLRFEHQHLELFCRQPARGRDTCRACADDNHVGIVAGPLLLRGECGPRGQHCRGGEKRPAAQ